MSDARTIDAARLTRQAPVGRWVIVADESDALLNDAFLAGRVPIHNQDGTLIGEFVPIHVWDDAAGTPAEDAEDIRRAELAMQEESIPWEDIKAELGL